MVAGICEIERHIIAHPEELREVYLIRTGRYLVLLHIARGFHAAKFVVRAYKYRYVVQVLQTKEYCLIIVFICGCLIRLYGRWIAFLSRTVAFLLHIGP